MVRRIEIMIEVSDEVWARMLRPDEGYTPDTEEGILDYFLEYVDGAYMDDGVTYSGRLV